MKVRYKEFKTGEEVAEWYAADNIIQIVPLNPGFGVFSKTHEEYEIQDILLGHLPGRSYFENESSSKYFKGLRLDILELGFSKDELKTVFEVFKNELKRYRSKDNTSFYDLFELDGTTMIAKNSNYFKDSKNDI